MKWTRGLKLGIWLFPFLPLFKLGYGYYSDWYVNLWMIEYHARYFWDKLGFPDVYHTAEMIGMPTPIFYGPVFYKIAGVLAAPFGASIALRLLILIASGIQFLILEKLIFELSKNRKLSILVGATLGWSIYTLTCLYNRSAVAEFFGIHFLTTTLALMVLVMLRAEFRWRSCLTWSVGFFYLMTLGTHTLTGVIGAPMLVGTFLVLLPLCKWRKEVGFTFVLQGLLVAAAMSPWLYANFKFGKILNIVMRANDILILPQGIDLWWARFSPWPLDPRSWYIPLAEISTPHLAAQISLALLLVCAFFLFVSAKKFRFKSPAVVILFGAAVTCLSYFASVSLGFWETVPMEFRIVQFGYRLVTYTNLGLLILLIGLLLQLRQHQMEIKFPSKLFWFLLILASLGPIGKMLQSQDVTAPNESRVEMSHLPPEYAGAVDFGVWYFYPRPDFKELGIELFETKLVPWYGVNFGTVLDGTSEIKQKTYLLTNVLGFPWNFVLINAEIPEYFMSSYYIGAVVPPGSQRLSYTFSPPLTFKVLKILSILVLFVWCLTLGLSAAKTFYQLRVKSRA